MTFEVACVAIVPNRVIARKLERERSSHLSRRTRAETLATQASQPRPQGAFPWLWRWGAPPPKSGKSALGTRLSYSVKKSQFTFLSHTVMHSTSASGSYNTL